MDAAHLAHLDRMITIAKGTRGQKLLAMPRRVLASLWLQRRALRSGRPIRRTVPLFFGGSMLVVLPDQVSLMLYRYGFFEEELTKALMHFLKPGMTFFDIGAHFGYCSLLAGHLVGPQGHIHAFEPTFSTFEILKSNLGGQANVSLNNVAVFSRQDTLDFHDYGSAYPAFNSLYGGKLGEDLRARLKPTTLKVPAITVDDYVAGTDATPDFIKIDTEGAEPEVLKGMVQTLARHHPVLSLEVGDHDDQEILPSRAVVAQVMSYGYRPLEFRAGQFVEHRPLARYGYTNLLFVKG